MKRILLAYSGSAAAAHAFSWLAARDGAEIVTLTLDLGQGKELEAVRDRALSLGAVRAHVLDVHDTFVREYLFRALKAWALSDGPQRLAAALTRPLIAERLCEVARIEQTRHVAHTCPEGDERIAVAARALDPELQVIAAPRGSTGTPAPPRTAVAPAEPAVVEVGFERGVPVAINGIVMPPVDLIRSLEIIARAHALDEALQLLSTAHHHLQQTVAPHGADDLRRRYVGLIERGDWFAPARRTLDDAVARSQERVSGTVTLKLFEGGCEISGCQLSPPSKRLPVIA